MSTIKIVERGDNLERLIEKHTEQLQIVSQQLELWRQRKAEYEQLADLIDKLKDRVKHKHMIPVAGTQMALMPGDIIHTNEIMVLLGDNLFALRSSRQAIEIIERRKRHIQNMILSREKSKKNFETWIEKAHEYRADKEQFVEIIETVDTTKK